MDFINWWNEIGSALRPSPDEDMEEFAKFVAFMAWEAALEKSKNNEEKS